MTSRIMLLRLCSLLFVLVLSLCVLVCSAVALFGDRLPADDDSWQRFGFLLRPTVFRRNYAGADALRRHMRAC